MPLRNASRADKRRSLFELFEERLALSAQPIGTLLPDTGVDVLLEQHYEDITPVDPGGDFRIDVELVHQIEDHAGSLLPQLANAHQSTGVDYVHSTFGFGGQGQTVAIIDSGIAYDHFSLGAGFGEQYRVVGGYDFAEGDADPYDDGPAGFHGTHVAGIVGSDHPVHQGVAPDVDLVALRVFDDDGTGFFSWVESALTWVHDNRNNFDNPITTVNLSLGTTWNSDSVPNWTTIEDELALLKSDGIFVAASAGNSFQDYNVAGLSYPAASPSIVPVSSVAADGNFSYFSQRNTRVLAAPGESIISTVPDHVFGSDGVPDDLGAASGTSMASPYVAGTSALVRQAMEFVGMQGITQDTIYDHLRNTADVFFDEATSANYHRINVQSALDALMPVDDYGSTLAEAHNLGVLGGQTSQSGLIGALSDVDFFTFTAAAHGTVTMSVTGDHDLVPNTSVIGATATVQGNTLSFDVVAGQDYSISIETAAGNGIGFYDADIELLASTIDLGTVDFDTFADQNLSSSETWYQLTNSRDGVLTVEALFSHTAGDVNLELYDTSNQLLRTSNSASDNERVDWAGSAGETFLLKASGINSDVDLRATNLVALTNNNLYVYGTTVGDNVVANLATGDLTVNGTFYVDALEIYANTIVYGGGGNDDITIHGSAAAETALFQVGSLNIANSTDRIYVLESESITVHSGGGFDRATLTDSDGNDEYTGRRDSSVLQGPGYRQEVTSFSDVKVEAVNGGYDRAHLFDSSSNDHFVARSDSSVLYANDYSFYNVAEGFEQVDAYATSGGYDRAYLHDSAANDLFVGRADHSILYATDYSYYNVANGFEQVDAYSINGGYDRAYLYDSVSNDHFVGREDTGILYANDYSFYNVAHEFDQVDAFATGGGYDRAYLHDASTNDFFVATPDSSVLYARDYSFYNRAHSFDQVDAFATAGGYDQAHLYDGATNDLFVGRRDTSVLYASDYSFYNVARGFDQVDAHAIAGGYNRAYLYDSGGSDYFVGRQVSSVLYATDYSYYNVANGFSQVDAYASGGYDRAFLHDSSGNDLFVARPLSSVLYASDYSFYNVAHAFSQVDGHASAGGTDRAVMLGSAGNDLFVGRPNSSVLYASDYSFYNVAKGFGQVEADASSGGFDRAFFYDSAGDDQLSAGGTIAGLTGSGFSLRARSFDRVDASGSAGGNDSAVYYEVENGNTVYGRNNYAILTTALTSVRVEDFEQLDAVARAGDTPEADVVAVDYLFDALGNWN